MSITPKDANTVTGRVSTHHFRRANGEPFSIELTIHITALAEDIAAGLARSDKNKATKCGGAIIAKVIS